MSNIEKIRERASHLMDTAQFESATVFGRCVIAAAKLEDGAILTASHVFETEEGFDPAAGAQMCLQKIYEQVVALEVAASITLTKAQAKAIVALSENNQVITAAAKQLNCPRAALTVQLRKIKEQTGHDPQTFKGLCQLLLEARSVLKGADGE